MSLDQLAAITPLYCFTRRIDACIQPERKCAVRELASRVASFFVASLAALASCIIYVCATVITAIITPIKLPFTLLHLILDENKFLIWVHDKIPGISDVFKNAYKTAIFALMIPFSSPAGLISPKTMVKVHVYLELSKLH